MIKKWAVRECKSLGIPARGQLEILTRKINILKTHPKLWSKQDFEIILPHLSIHQDFRAGSLERVDSIMANGLQCGMVDSLYNMLTRKNWTFAQCLIGSPAYIFVDGAIKYKSKTNPYLAAGNKPLFVIFPEKRGADVFSSINSTATSYLF
jgi:hypothetical protein